MPTTPPQLNEEQQRRYFAEEGSKERPLSPLEFLAREQGQSQEPPQAPPQQPVPTTSPEDGIVSTTDSLRATNTAIESAIGTESERTALRQESEQAIRQTTQAQHDFVQAQRTALERRQQLEEERIMREFGLEEERQGQRQQREFGGFSTRLTQAGGHLGFTASQEGALVNLERTHTQERQALLTKRESALAIARNAFEDRDFKLAQEQLQMARQVEKDIAESRNNFADQQLRIIKEIRESDVHLRKEREDFRKRAEEEIQNWALMSNEELANIPASRVQEIEREFNAPGFVARYIETEREAKQVKTFEQNVKHEMDVLKLLSSIPENRFVTIGGERYAGIKPLPREGAPSMKGLITQEVADIVGLPSELVGANEREIILSLEMENPPAWFIQTVSKQTQAPEFSRTLQFAGVSNPLSSTEPRSVKQQWSQFRTRPDVVAYRNTVRLDSRQLTFHEQLIQTSREQEALRAINSGDAQTATESNTQVNQAFKDAGIKMP
jgi:predicted RNase H-like nuclease